jgi:acetylglutamate kinase
MNPKEILHIVKIGGKVVDDEAMLQTFLDQLANTPGRKILVHGGGKGATALSEKLGVPTQMVEGRRITDDATLEIAVMVYAGWFNKSVVALLQARGCNAIGLSGTDGNLILAEKRPVKTIDYGWVGDIKTVNAQGIAQLLEADLVPVFCAITHNGKGQLLNTNADTIAASLASALVPQFTVHLSFFFEKNGVLLDPQDDSALIPVLDPTTYRIYREQGNIHTGMVPKLDNAFVACAAGVERVRICGPDSFMMGGGTQIIHQPVVEG